MKKILIIVGGSVKKVEAFSEAATELGLDVNCASFTDLNFASTDSEYSLRVGDNDITNYGLVYIRMVGKRLEDATLLVNYLKEKNIKVVDRLYEHSLLMPSTISKAYETAKLVAAGVPMPKTYFGRLTTIIEKATNELGFPFILKSTSGRKAREVWIAKDKENLDELYPELRQMEKQGMRFFAQEFVKASQRIRALVIGGEVVGAITRPTKWRKSFIEKVNGEFPEGIKAALNPVPGDIRDLALKASKAAQLDVAGIDILQVDDSDKMLVIEANAAPAWKLIAKDTGVNVEEKVLKFLKSLL